MSSYDPEKLQAIINELRTYGLTQTEIDFLAQTENYIFVDEVPPSNTFVRVTSLLRKYRNRNQ